MTWVSQLEELANAGKIPGLSVSSVYTDLPQPEVPGSPVSLPSEAAAEAPSDTRAMVDIMMQLHRELSGKAGSGNTVAQAQPQVSSEFELTASTLREALRARPAIPKAAAPVNPLPQFQPQFQSHAVSSGLPGVLNFFSAPGPSTQPTNPGVDSSGVPICKFYNQGGCSKGVSCRFSHVCSLCRGQHPAFDHDRISSLQSQPPSSQARMSWRNL